VVLGRLLTVLAAFGVPSTSASLPAALAAGLALSSGSHKHIFAWVLLFSSRLELFFRVVTGMLVLLCQLLGF
jgi:hypothetical protein